MDAVSPLLSSQLTSILSPFAPPLRRKVNTGLRDTAWLICASTTVLPFCFTVTFWKKCSGWLLGGVVIGWVISTRTSVKPLPSVARIFIGPAAMSASAPADGYFDFLGGGVAPAAGRGHRAHVGGLVHLDVELHVGQRAVFEIELRGKREGVLLDHHCDRRGSG